MSGPPVLLECNGPVAWVTLNRPDQMNAMSAAMRDGLAAAFDAIEASHGIRAVIITGEGRAFSAGGDLKEFKAALNAGDDAVLSASVKKAGDVLSRIEHCPLPVIAAVNGVAVAGGLELILCCDIVIAAEDARIGDGHLKYGVLPGGGGAVRLLRKLPANIAKKMLFTGELLPARTLMEFGLVNDVVPADKLRPHTSALAERIAGLSPLAMRMVKEVANGAVEKNQEASLREEFDMFRRYAGSADFLEGLRAFEEKRVPKFTGK
jgi:enoyl-CoA hydratase/carnithine racemase